MNKRAIFETQCGLGEGAYWHPLHKKWYWLDIKAHQIYCYDPLLKTSRYWQLPGLVSVVCGTKTESLLIIGFEDTIATFDLKTEAIATLFNTHTGMRMNDGYVDTEGRFWIGQADASGQAQARLYCYSADGSCVTQETGLTISNGLDWDLARKRFYLTDTLNHVIYVYDYDSDTGAISHRRPFINPPVSAGYPDGMVLDAAGYLWVCFWEGSQIIRYSPEGDIDRVIEVPVKRPTKCAFGGDDFSTVLITSAASDVNSEIQLAPPNGYVFLMDTDVIGRPATLFGR